MLEKRFAAVPPQDFTADGTVDGVITIADSACRLFKVKQHVFLTADGQPNIELEIKEIDGDGNIQVGPLPGLKTPSSITTRSDISAYTVARNATIFANLQGRPKIDWAEASRAAFEEEPTVAMRNILVDDCGNKIDRTNPLPVAFDGTISIGNVRISAEDNDPMAGDIHSSVRIGDGTNEMAVNSDGSINVNVVYPDLSPGLNIVHTEVSSVVSGVETIMYTFVAPTNGFKVYRIDVSGENIALFRVKVDSVNTATKRTFFSNLNENFIFEPFENALKLTSGQQLQVTVLHNRPFTANFEVTVTGVDL